MKFKKLGLAAAAAATMVTATSAYASIIDRPFFQVLGVVVVWGADGFDATSNAPVVTDFVLLTTASGTAGADLIGGAAADGNTVVTGTLDPISSTGANAGVPGASVVNPVTGATSGGALTENGNGVLDAGDSLTAFGVDAATDITGGLVNSHRSSFFVASNAAFDIYAETSNVVATGDWNGTLDESDISFSMGLTVADAAAPLPFGSAAQSPMGGTGVSTGLATLASLPAPGTPTKVFGGNQRTAATPGSLTEQSVRFDNTYELGGGTGYDLSDGVGTLQADVTFTIYVP